MDGEAFGPYVLRSLLGQGGMGEVWRAHDTRREREVALKRMSPLPDPDGEFHRRFLHEAYTTAGLDSVHVIPIHDFGEIDGRLFLDMRLVEGPDLDRTIRASGTGMTPERAVGVLAQIADALDAAHARNLVHRDVKPSNVLLGRARDRDFGYLTDFGIAKNLDDTGITRTGAVVGTLPYMAPELFGSGEAGPASDVYALGCVLFEMLTARRAISGEGTAALVGRILHGDPPATDRPDLARFDPLLVRALARAPDDRPPSAGALAREAKALVAAAAVPGRRRAATTLVGTAETAPPSGGPQSARPTEIGGTGPAGPAPPDVPDERVPARRRRALALTGGALLAVASVVAALLVGRGGPVDTDPDALRAAPTSAAINESADLRLSSGGDRAWVTANGSRQFPSRRVDFLTFGMTPPVRLAAQVGPNPYGLAVSPDDRELYVSSAAPDDREAGALSVVDASTAVVTATIPLADDPTGVAADPEGRWVFVAQQEPPPATRPVVSRVDVRTRQVDATVLVGRGPGFLAVSPDGGTLYVPHETESWVSAIDTATMQVRSITRTSAAPQHVTVSPDGQTVYVAARGTRDAPEGVIDVLDARTMIPAGPAVRRPGLHPQRTALTPDGDFLVATVADNPSGATGRWSVALVDLASRTVIRTVPVGDGAGAVSVTPDGRRAYVATYSGVWTVDLAGGE